MLAAALDAGLCRIELIRESFAAAIGAGLRVGKARAPTILESGAGATEIAVFSIIGQCTTRSVRLGGQTLDEALLKYLSTAFGRPRSQPTIGSLELISTEPFDT